MDEYFQAIDRLRAKFDAGKPLYLRDASWIFWAELNSCWTPIYLFAHWVKNNGVTVDQKLGWSVWKSLFEVFMKEEYPKVERDYDLIAKLHKTNVDKLFGKLRD